MSSSENLSLMIYSSPSLWDSQLTKHRHPTWRYVHFVVCVCLRVCFARVFFFSCAVQMSYCESRLSFIRSVHSGWHWQKLYVILRHLSLVPKLNLSYAHLHTTHCTLNKPSSFPSSSLSTLQQCYLLLHLLLSLSPLLSPGLGLSFIDVLSLFLSEAGEKALLPVRGRGYRIISPQKATTCLHTGGKYPSVEPSSTGQWDTGETIL